MAAAAWAARFMFVFAFAFIFIFIFTSIGPAGITPALLPSLAA